jgi:hypothetical protein
VQAAPDIANRWTLQLLAMPRARSPHGPDPSNSAVSACSRVEAGCQGWPASQVLRFDEEPHTSRVGRSRPARTGSLLLGLPPLWQIFLRQRRGGRLGLHRDVRNSPAAGFFDRLNAVDAACNLLAVAVQRVAAP